MRQILQNLTNGATELAEVPQPRTPDGGLLIQTRRSLISAGTERMLVDFGRAGWLEKARQQPEKVRQVLDRIAAEGVPSTLEAVRGKLDQPVALGYCNVGVVIGVGAGVTGFAVGDRVVSNGPHAEIVAVPRNLCAKVPAGVTDDEAALTVLGAIGLQGVRLAEPTLGESFVVIGLGLIGLVTVQLLQANGCRVMGIDPDPAKSALAKRFGATVVDIAGGEDPLAAAAAFTSQRGVDGVVITAATASSEPVSRAARMCRKRGRIVLVGVTGLELNRAEFYEKELTFQVSCSYGPGRYDPAYEARGHDYPLGFVRWTAQRNFEAVLDLLASKRVAADPLITHRFSLDDAPAAYELLSTGNEPYLGLLLVYPDAAAVDRRTTLPVRQEPVEAQRGRGVVGLIGAGNYASRMLIPALARTGATLRTIVSAGGVTAGHFGRKYGFEVVATDVDAVFGDPSIDTVIIATRHDSHAELTRLALDAGKHVFVEKPLALTLGEVEEVERALAESGRLLCVGFNRRFAPHVAQARAMIVHRTGPLVVNITVNAGALPQDHWTRNPRVGGGRIVGEACHFIDLARALVGHGISALHVASALTKSGRQEDIALLQLSFDDGSLASIQYLSNGNRRYPKERVELFWDAKTLRLDNFRRMEGWGVPVSRNWGFARQDKGHAALLAAFIDAVRSSGPSPISTAELMEVSRWSVEARFAAAGEDRN
jgi:predicted dehydrogenase/threonine dehydrogenase-like Zn-dependent dehydrogenase